MSHGPQHGAKNQVGREAHLEADGTVKCVCGEVIVFLPAAMPAGGPNSVNHAGCTAALHEGETINLIARDQVEAFYKPPATAKARK